MPTLYVIEPGALLEKEYHRILVTKEDEVLFRTQVQHISQVVLVGPVNMTTPAMHSLLDNKITVTLVKRSGEMVGQLIPPISPNISLRRKQYGFDECSEEKFLVAKEIVRAKIHNQRILALRIIRRHLLMDEIPVEGIRNLEKASQQATDLNVLRGIEGSAARLYFEVYEKAFEPVWNFTNRNRRPPRDPINALLSLGYTLLGNTLTTTLQIVGLDPYLGIFHEEKPGRPALALDLLEEFRAPIVDSLVMTLVNKKQITPDDFEKGTSFSGDGNGVLLGDKAIRLFFREFSKKLDSTVSTKDLDRSISYRKIFEIQARKLAKVMSGQEKIYQPFRAR